MTAARWVGKLQMGWERAHTSLWFIPSLLVVAAAILSSVLLYVDGELGTGYATGWWLFGGSADGARTVLSVISGSLITVIAVAFSVTIIAIQQASTQFTPRVLRNFTRDRGNQIVLGTYIATFTYALLVLRRVREATPEGPEFVPSIAISTAMLLALVSLGMLVYFIHHVSEALQVSYLLSSVRSDLDHELERLFPQRLGEAPDDAESIEHEAIVAEHGEPSAIVTMDGEGYLRHIDLEELTRAAKNHARFVRIDVQVGEYLRHGDTIVRAWSSDAVDEAFEARVRGSFRLDRDRSLSEDPLFGIRQIVDIAVKAMSPGVNDPTTAEQALDHLAGALTVLLDRAFPSPLRVVEGGTMLLFKTPTFRDYVEASFMQVRRAARADLHVSLYLCSILHKLIEQAPDSSYAAPLRHELDEVVAGFDHDTLTRDESEALHRVIWREIEFAANVQPTLHH